MPIPLSPPVRAVFGVEALLSHAQALDRVSGDQVPGDNLRRVRGLDVAVPDRLGIDHYHRTMLALVQAAGLVDAHPSVQTGGSCQLLQPSVQLAYSIGSAGRPRRVRGAEVAADKDVALKCGQAAILLDPE